MNHNIDGKYKVTYKEPRHDVERRKQSIQSKTHIFEGVCENFSTGLSAFRNEQDQLLLVDYQDIIQLKPISE